MRQYLARGPECRHHESEYERGGGGSVLDERVLVAGAGGFIGGHLVKYLAGQGFSRIRAVDIKPVGQWFQVHPQAEVMQLDLRSPSAARQAVDGCGSVVNLAADTGGVGFSSRSRARCALSVVLNAGLLSAAAEAGARRYLFASSACVYPEHLQASADAAGLREEDAYPAMPEDGQGWEKLLGERMCRYVTEELGLPTRVARYFSVYGSHGPWHGGREKAPAALCRKVAEAIHAGAEEIEVWGDGDQTRTFLHVDDCVRGTLMILQGDLATPVNLGSPELVSVNQLLDVIEEIAGVRMKRRYNLGAPAGVRGRRSDNALLRSAFGWEPSIRLREGMAETYRWVYDQVSARTLTSRRG
ncbi:MAG TPA: NAD-dependent epimerase/dehydratase family protein [Streptosporangiaceae bacterium]|nr:NAD-dependent epimerase/dehydratase family protein [Streptosporangiaceae bacterium]